MAAVNFYTGGTPASDRDTTFLPDREADLWLCQPELAPGGRLELAPFVWS